MARGAQAPSRPRLPGQAECARGDDAELNLVGAAVDGVSAAEQVAAAASRPGRTAGPAPPSTSGPSMCIASSPRSRCQRDHSNFTTEALGLCARGCSPIEHAQDLFSHDFAGRSTASASLSRSSGSAAAPVCRARSISAVELAPVADLLAEGGDAAFEAEGRHRDAPAVPDVADHHVAGVRAPSKKTSLNSDVPVSWRIGRT